MKCPFWLFFAGALVGGTAPVANAENSWALYSDDSSSACVTQTLTGHVSASDLKTENGVQYQSAPDEFSLHWVRWGGIFGSTIMVPHTQVVNVQRAQRQSMNKGVRLFDVTLRSGEILKIDDNFTPAWMCRAGVTTLKGGGCVPAYYLAATCIDEKEGITSLKYLSLDFNRNGVPPANAEKIDLSKFEQVPKDTMQKLLANFEAAKQARPRKLAAREAALKFERAASMKLQQDDMAESEASALAFMKKAPVNTVMFCESGDRFLLGAGEPISRLSYKCDTFSKEIDVRTPLKYGWEMVSQIRSPMPSMGGETAFLVSLQFKKIRKQ